MDSIPENHGLKKFENLKTSTRTVVIYTNLVFNLGTIFKNITLTKVDAPLTKRQKNVDKKKMVAPYGAIVNVQSKTAIRGVDTRRKKKRWCTVCQPFEETEDGDIEYIYTITEELEKVENDIMAIRYYCSNCETRYKPEEIKRINHFLNQLTMVISTGKQPLLNIMIFKDKLKIAGCKNVDDAVETILILFQDYLIKMKNSFTLKQGAKNPRFIFDSAMRNVGFKLGFPIERPALNFLMNDKKYRDRIFMSQYESTAHTNVNIKMYSKKPDDFHYDCLVIPLNGVKKDPYFIKLPNIPSTYKKDKKTGKEKYVTFIVFSSSEIILSGKYDKNMREMYDFFVDTIFKNKNLIEEKLETPNKQKIKELV